MTPSRQFKQDERKASENISKIFNTNNKINRINREISKIIESIK